MLTIRAINPSDQLRKLSVFLDGDFTESLSASKLTLDNSNGKGVITNYTVFPGLEVRTYNIEFTKEVVFSKEELHMNPLYFLYCIEGYVHHKFEEGNEINKVGHLQNVILSSATDKDNTIIIPANVKLAISVIFVMKEQMTTESFESRGGLWKQVFELFEVEGQDTAFQYFGEITPVIAQYTRILINNDRTDIVGRLLAESAVLSTISEQIKAYQKSSGSEGDASHGLRDEELSKIIQLGDYIKARIGEKLSVKELSETVAMGPAKLQSGVQYVFGETVNNLIIRLKMERARELLLHSNITVSEIVYTIGLSSRSYFSKKFKEIYGLLPSDFRKKISNKSVVFELSYRSKAVQGLRQKEINAMVVQARNFNSRNDISGCLVHHEDAFFQIIEGPKRLVLDLYEKIKEDSRHEDVELIWKGFRVERTFKNWHLATVSDGGILEAESDSELFEHINVNEMLDSLKNSSVAADILWKRISDRMKVAG